MNINTALTKQQNARSAMRAHFSWCAAFGAPHSEMLRWRNEYRAKHLAKCPRWVHSYLQGVWDCLTDDLYANQLVFGAWIDGKFYSTHSKRDDYYERQGVPASVYADMTHEQSTVGHYWKNDVSKPFYITKETVS